MVLGKLKGNRKIAAVAVSLAVIIALGIGSTIAWLSSQSETVVNVFHGENINVKIDESAVGIDGRIDENADRTTGNEYTFVAGSVLDKDPTATVLKNSADCYVYIYVENNLADYTTLDIDEENWALVDNDDGLLLYRYIGGENGGVVKTSSDEDTKLPPLFTTVTFNEDIVADDIADIDKMESPTIEITAFAVQAENIDLDTADDFAIANFTGGV